MHYHNEDFHPRIIIIKIIVIIIIITMIKLFAAIALAPNHVQRFFHRKQLNVQVNSEQHFYIETLEDGKREIEFKVFGLQVGFVDHPDILRRHPDNPGLNILNKCYKKNNPGAHWLFPISL